MMGEALQISPANDPCGSPAKEQQAAGVGIILQIIMLVLSFVLGHVLRRHKFYYLPEASASLLIGFLRPLLAQCLQVLELDLFLLCFSSMPDWILTNAENFQICQRDGTCTAGCVLQEKEGLLELVEKGKITARTEKSGQNASIDGCSHRDENPAVGAHKKCDRELFLLIFQYM